MQVDVVIPFVDGHQPSYREQHERWAGQPPPCQLRSLGELRYALRSIQLYAPWVRQVWLVVQDRGHLPGWLNPNSLQVVLHEQFVPPEYLPTFQYLPLFYFLDRIPGLAEHYVLWNDDYFLGSSCLPGHFFNDQGEARPPVLDWPIPRWLGRIKRDGFTQSLLGTVRILDEELAGPPRLHYQAPHVPLPVTRSGWRRFCAQFEQNQRLQFNLNSRCRPPEGAISLEDLYINWLLPGSREPWRLLSCLRGQALNAGFRLLRRVSGRGPRPGWGIYGVYNQPERTARQLAALLSERPQLYCINDNAYDLYDGFGHGWEVHPRSLELLEQSLRQLYPQASRYEAE